MDSLAAQPQRVIIDQSFHNWVSFKSAMMLRDDSKHSKSGSSRGNEAPSKQKGEAIDPGENLSLVTSAATSVTGLLNQPLIFRSTNRLLDTKAHRSDNFMVITTPQTPERKGDSVTPSSRHSAPTQNITLYHWLVVILASAGWLFDCMGQRIFV